MKNDFYFMTKYILHGGVTSRDTDDNRKFFLEIVKNLKSPINILCVYFAREKKEWKELFKQDKLNFLRASQKKRFKFVLANDDLKNFTKQIKNSDVVHLRGGKTELLLKKLSKIDNLILLFENKVISGSSAGAYVLSKYYINSGGEIKNGLGILPIKVISHYTKEKYDLFQRLKNYKENLKIYKISEEKFVVIGQ